MLIIIKRRWFRGRVVSALDLGAGDLGSIPSSAVMVDLENLENRCWALREGDISFLSPTSF